MTDLKEPDNQPTNVKVDANFAKNITIIETAHFEDVPGRTVTKMSTRRLPPRISYEQFNEVEPEQQEKVNSDKVEVQLVNVDKC